MNAILELNSVTKTYSGPQGPVSALARVSLKLSPGDFAAIQGASGSGKSTLLLTSGGLLRPDEGQVLVAGVDLYARSQEDRARLRGTRIGFVFQQFHLVPYLTVLENVLAPSVTHREKDLAGRAHQLIDQFGLTSRSSHLPAELSTGERQRTALARALLNQPTLLLADEPTGNLDRDNAATVLQALAGFAREGGAVLLVTHDPQTAAGANRQFRMYAGQCVESPAVSLPVAGGSGRP